MNGEEESRKEFSRHPFDPLIEELQRSRVCFYLGRGRGRKPDLGEFVEAVPFLGECDALVFAEPQRSRGEVGELLRGNLPIPIRGGFGFVSGLELVLPNFDYSPMFVEPSEIERVPPEEWPSAERLWAEWTRMRVEDRQGQGQNVLLVHIGLGGLAAMLYFFEPNKIVVSKIIGSPF